MNARPRDRVAMPAEMEQLLAALHPADAPPYALAAYATARRAEIRHARVEDVDLELGVIYRWRGRADPITGRTVSLEEALRDSE